MWHTSQDFRFNTRLMRVDVEKGRAAIWEYGGVEWDVIAIKGRIYKATRHQAFSLLANLCGMAKLPRHWTREMGGGNQHCRLQGSFM